MKEKRRGYISFNIRTSSLTGMKQILQYTKYFGWHNLYFVHTMLVRNCDGIGLSRYATVHTIPLSFRSLLIITVRITVSRFFRVSIVWTKGLALNFSLRFEFVQVSYERGLKQIVYLPWCTTTFMSPHVSNSRCQFAMVESGAMTRNGPRIPYCCRKNNHCIPSITYHTVDKNPFVW